MNFQKPAIVFLLLLIATGATLLAPKIGREIYNGFYRVLDIRIPAYYRNFIMHVLAAVLCAWLMYRFRIHKRVIVPIVIVVVATSLLVGRYQFYYYQQHPQLSDIKGYYCLFEHNYATYWDYLTKGCHVTIGDVVKGQIIRSVVWTSVVFGSLYLFRKFRRKRTSSDQDRLIDG